MTNPILTPGPNLNPNPNYNSDQKIYPTSNSNLSASTISSQVQVQPTHPNYNPLDFDNQKKEKEPEIEEEVVKIRKISIKTWFRAIMLFILLIFLAILYWSPKTITEPLKYYLNGDFGNEVIDYAIDEKPFDINNYFSNDGKITLKEKDVFKLINSGPQFKFDRVESEENNLTVFTNLSKEGNPLWLVMTIEEKDEKFVFSKVGFGRFKLPQWLAENLLQNTYGKVVNSDNPTLLGPVLSQFLGPQLSKVVNPESIEFKNDEVVIDLKKNKTIFEELDLESKADELIKNYENYDMNEIKDWLSQIGLDNSSETNK